MGRAHVVVVAGWDPSGGAGLLRDADTFTRLGVRHAGVVTAITTQDPRARGRVKPVDSETVRQQLEGAWGNGSPIVKIGMLYSLSNIRAVAAWLRRHPTRGVVVDPVLESKGGLRLATRDAVDGYREIVRLATVFTPNLREAGLLLSAGTPSKAFGPNLAALQFHEWGAGWVLLKLPRKGRIKSEILFDGNAFRVFSNRRAAPFEIRGSGCTLASSISAFLAHGDPPARAIGRGLAYTRSLFARSRSSGRIRMPD